MKIKINKKYLFYIIIILITCFLFYYIYNKYNHNILKKNIIKKLNNSYELFNNIKNSKNKEFFSNINEMKINKKDNNLKNTIEYSYYKSNKHDTYDMLNRDLLLYNHIHTKYNDKNNYKNNNNKNNNKNNKNNKNKDIYEHMSTNEQQNINDLFPDLDNSAFAMEENEKTSNLLVTPEFEPDNVVMSDALLEMDSRPNEQKDLDNLLDDLNTYIYLLRNSIINDLNNKRDITLNQKITLYYNLFKDTLYMAKEANNIYNENKEIPNYIIDSNLDKKSELFLSNLSPSILTIYSNLITKKDIENNKNVLIQLNIPIPTSLDSEEEDDIVNPLTILREFADNISSMYDSLNVIIAPYYNFVFELGIAPYPKDDDNQDPNSPDNKAGAAIISSFMTEMLSFSSSYNDAMINYIMNENIYIELIKNKDYKNNLLKLPYLTTENITNINELYSRKVIDDNQISSFDKSVQDATIVYNYFMALYYLMKADPNPDNLDTETIEKILRGSVTFNTKDRFSLIKKYDPTADNDQYTFGIKNMVTNGEYIFVSPIVGFTTEKAVPSSPSKANITKKKNELAKVKEALEKAMKAAAEAAEKAAAEAKEALEKAAKETERLAKEAAEKAAAQAKAAQEAMEKAAKETERLAKEAAEKAAKEAKELAEKTERLAKEAAEKAAKEAEEAAKKTKEAAEKAAKEAEQIANDIDKGAKNTVKKIGKALKKIKI